MKTTIELPDSLMTEAKECARAKGVPLRQLIEEGLRVVLESSKQPRKKFVLRDGSFDGGRSDSRLSWAETRAIIYEGRGE
jgi:hypothetical protein